MNVVRSRAPGFSEASIAGSRGTSDTSDDIGRVTPMMEQYLEIKAANPGLLLFYRMGDFYEMFFEDAEIASRALGIVLTKRGKHLGRDIPMCGVPIERADEYLHRLIGLGHRVAVCEQTEDPAEARKRGGKSVVRRDVVRLVTPGTLTEDTLLEARRNNYLLAIARARLQRRRRPGRRPLRDLLDRYLHRRVPRCGVRSRRARGGPGEARTRRDHRVGCALRRSRPRAAAALAAVGGAARTRCIRRRHRGAAARGLFRGLDHPGVRNAFPARADRRGRLHHLCGAHAARPTPGAVAADARARRNDARHRPGDAQQPRADARAFGRPARLAAQRDRPHGDAAGLAAAGAAARRAAHRSRPQSRSGTTRSRCSSPKRRREPSCANGSRQRPISPARWRDSCSGAAARATLPPSATGSLRRA